MATVRLQEDGPAFAIYRTGTFQIRGAENEEELEEAVQELKTALEACEVAMPTYSFKHQTSVFLEDLGRSVNLEAALVSLGLENTEYEPEQFPGLVYRPPDFDLTLLVFATGKVITGGTTDRSMAEDAISQLSESLDSIEVRPRLLKRRCYYYVRTFRVRHGR